MSEFEKDGSFVDPLEEAAQTPGYAEAEAAYIKSSTIQNAVCELLAAIEGAECHDLREGLIETPARVAKAYETWFGGYAQDPKDVLKVFEDGAEGCDEMVVVKDIPVWSHCEHHMAPFFGTATIAYIPNKKIVGLSKLTRLVEVFARRLQVQERLTNEIADAIQEHLEPLGCAVYVNCRHTCVESRGVKSQGQSTITTALRGNIKSQPETRGEFLSYTR